MTEIGCSDDLRCWVGGTAVEFSYVLAVRIALRVVPFLDDALYADEEQRLRQVISPTFLALAGANFAAAWPRKIRAIHNVAQAAAQKAQDAVDRISETATRDAIDLKDVLPFEAHEEIRQIENDASALIFAQNAVADVAEATQIITAIFDVRKGIASPESVYNKVVSVARLAQGTIEISCRSSVFYEGKSVSDVDPNVGGFWKTIELDIESLEANIGAEHQPEEVVADLSNKPLWLGGAPVWASDRWAKLREKLSDSENERVWIDWYEQRLMGQRLDASRETKLIDSQHSPLEVTVASMFDQVDVAQGVSRIELQQQLDRVLYSLAKDPIQAIGATKDMLETTMKTILYRRGSECAEHVKFPKLAQQCLDELRLSKGSRSTSDLRRHLSKIVSNAQKMILSINEIRNLAGTGHGRVLGKEPRVTDADARLVASAGLMLVAWLLHHSEDA